MKYIKKILFLIILNLCFIGGVNAKEKNLVNIYLFHSDTCSHCKSEIKLLDELEKEYDNIKIYKYEISNPNNSSMLTEVMNIYKINSMGVPFTVIGDTYYSGFSYENTKKTFISTIEYYSNYGYEDKVAGIVGNINLPTYEVKEEQISLKEYTKDYGNYTFKLPIIGKVNTKSLTLPIISIVIGLIDGFNPCAMWVLLFLISMLINMQDKKRMWTLGVTFLVTSALIYLLFMIAWLNVASLLTSIIYFRIGIACIAIIGGIINLKSYFTTKDDGCNVVNDKKRNKIFDKIKAFTKEKNFFLAILGVITLAISVNIVELACSAGLPVIFTTILSLNNLTTIEYALYMFLYMLFFLLDDLIVFIIAMTTLKLTGISTKYGKISKLVGGIILVLMGLLLIFKPDIIMLNF